MPNSIFERLHWIDEEALQSKRIPEPIQSWLFEKGSLTVRLKRHCERFEVKVRSEKRIEKTFENETALLGEKSYWCREVLLLGDNEPWAEARTLIANALLHRHQNLLQLGNQPIGKWLFSQAAQRQKIQWAFDSHRQLYARRSLFLIKQMPLLVSELFLEQSPLSDELNNNVNIYKDSL